MNSHQSSPPISTSRFTHMEPFVASTVSTQFPSIGLNVNSAIRLESRTQACRAIRLIQPGSCVMCELTYVPEDCSPQEFTDMAGNPPSSPQPFPELIHFYTSPLRNLEFNATSRAMSLILRDIPCFSHFRQDVVVVEQPAEDYIPVVSDELLEVEIGGDD